MPERPRVIPPRFPSVDTVPVENLTVAVDPCMDPMPYIVTSIRDDSIHVHRVGTPPGTIGIPR